MKRRIDLEETNVDVIETSIGPVTLRFLSVSFAFDELLKVGLRRALSLFHVLTGQAKRELEGVCVGQTAAERLGRQRSVGG